MQGNGLRKLPTCDLREGFNDVSEIDLPAGKALPFSQAQR